MDNKNDWTCIRSCEFNGDIVITDPHYINQKEAFGEETLFDGRGLVNTTFYGDWGCTVYRTPAKIGCIPSDALEIGKFCADSGMVCVVDLKDALNSFPEFESWLEERPWCGTIIRNFVGTVTFMTQKHKEKYDGHVYEYTELRVRGDGLIDGLPVSFESIQTSS